MAASIQEFGWRQPIVVDEAMVVLAGHTRLEAARSLPESIRLQEMSGGFHTPALLDARLDEAQVVGQAAQKGVTLAPLGRYCLTPIPQSGLVFGFGCVTPEDIARGIGILRELPALR